MKTSFSLLLAALLAPSAFCAEDAQSIFNAKDLSGWTGDPKIWSVQDGAITGHTTADQPLKANTFLIWTNGTAGDFELTCMYKLVPSAGNSFANSGIQYRSTILNQNAWVAGGYQADMEAGPNYTGILYEEKMTRGIMARRGEKVVWTSECNKQVTGSVGDSEAIQSSIKTNAWNHYRIVAKGNHIAHFVNGLQTVDVTDNCAAKAATNGVIALQMHVGAPFTAQFKDIKLRRF